MISAALSSACGYGPTPTTMPSPEPTITIAPTLPPSPEPTAPGDARLDRYASANTHIGANAGSHIRPQSGADHHSHTHSRGAGHAGTSSGSAILFCHSLFGRPGPESQPREDCRILLESRDTLIGPTASSHLNWDTDIPIAEWVGVGLDGSPLRVRISDLYGKGLTGQIPPALGDLPELRRLDAHRNQLTGGIPPELGKLSNLEYLNLFHNELGGEILPELGRLSNLRYLSLEEASSLARFPLGWITSGTWNSCLWPRTD